jgi:hypothetical protein
MSVLQRISNHIFISVFYLFTGISTLVADSQTLATIIVGEGHGLDRLKEYVECSVQLDHDQLTTKEYTFVIRDTRTNNLIYCQIIDELVTKLKNKAIIRFTFPVSISAWETKAYHLELYPRSKRLDSDLKMCGEKFDLVIENKFYRADLTKNIKVEPQSYDSGQIREIFVKMGYDQLLTNVEDRVHWGPNFKKPGLEWYTTIAHWQSPDYYQVNSGPYLIETKRKGPAPEHPEIMLIAVYKFYSDLPYFRFYSAMEMEDNIWLELLRNDEMTMDSMFTHLAFQRPDGSLVDVSFSERHELLKANPIENNSPWICFYNKDSGLAFGSIRIKYDNTNQYGAVSPLVQPHTQIGEWLAGIKYWNRRLIHDHLTYVPQGSRYIEENAYLVFSIDKQDKFKSMSYWANRLRHPLSVQVR